MDLTEQLLSELGLGYTVGDQVIDTKSETINSRLWFVWGINRANQVLLYNYEGKVRVLPADRLRKHEDKA